MQVRDELRRLIRLNDQEGRVPAHEALVQLGHIGDDLISGLIECLGDGHPDVRRLAVELLVEARPRSNFAVPALIERLKDEDWLVQIAVMTHIGDFGPVAAEAILLIEPWLESPNEYLRLLAASAILKIDLRRAELRPIIWDATASENPVVRDVAWEFLYGS